MWMLHLLNSNSDSELKNPSVPVYHEIQKFCVTEHFSEGFWQVTQTTGLHPSDPVCGCSRDLDTGFHLFFVVSFCSCQLCLCTKLLGSIQRKQLTLNTICSFALTLIVLCMN